MHRRIGPVGVTVSLFIIPFLILGAARNASALSVIYGGRNTVDLVIGQLSGPDAGCFPVSRYYTVVSPFLPDSRDSHL